MATFRFTVDGKRVSVNAEPAMPLLYGTPGDRKPITFIEDPAVPPAKLPEFIARFRDVLQAEGTDGSFYGHASVGCLHNPKAADAELREALAGLKCRCGTHVSILRAIKRAQTTMA